MSVVGPRGRIAGIVCYSIRNASEMGSAEQEPGGWWGHHISDLTAAAQEGKPPQLIMVGEAAEARE
jgi:hypothetical protein